MASRETHASGMPKATSRKSVFIFGNRWAKACAEVSVFLGEMQSRLFFQLGFATLPAIESTVASSLCETRLFDSF